jgi:hypothetical protein
MWILSIALACVAAALCLIEHAQGDRVPTIAAIACLGGAIGVLKWQI